MVIQKLFIKTTDENEIKKHIIFSYDKPLSLFMTILGGYLSLKYLNMSPKFDAIITNIFRSTIIFSTAWGLCNFSSAKSILFKRLTTRLNLEEDDVLVPFLSKAIQFIIVALAISIIAQEWGYDFNGFVAGLGIGGLAIALAAKEVVSNLFSGIILITEKPFVKNDWIKTPSVEGIVIDINLRSTTVRTFAQAMVTVPNSKIANEPITNWSRMGKRQVSFRIGIKNNLSSVKMKEVVDSIREMLKNHNEVNQDVIMVYLDEFKEERMEVFIYFFTNTTIWAEYLSVRQDINLQIKEILEKNEVPFASPVQTINIETVETPKPLETKENNDILKVK